MEVRSNGASGKFLFDWHPENNCVDIVKSGTFYRVELFHKALPAFKIVDKHPWVPPDKAKPKE
ncbi:hypothetical protein AXF17_02505 [Mogibacterium pumilum]|uniref:Uncharacterized protein n=1 Tax=Mogibacterium pumilum TaxID=86332 RepID=A0A223AR76_9FIRM|nr:hypothetical protein AXF17_02505 [Mogibacterium pumilum]